MNKILKKVKLNAPASTSTGVDPTKGTQTNPYTQEEYRVMSLENDWKGGYVEGEGYVMSSNMWDDIYSISGFSADILGRLMQIIQTLNLFAAECFWHYLYGEGDVVLPDEQWVKVKKIVGTINPSENTKYKIIEGDKTYFSKHVSFYDTEFANSLGTSTITFDSNGNPIGLYDPYDFDDTNRPFINQILADIGSAIIYVIGGNDYIITKGSKYFDYVNGD